MGAWLNVKINVGGLEDKEFAEKVLAEGKEMIKKAQKIETEILDSVEGKLK